MDVKNFEVMLIRSVMADLFSYFCENQLGEDPEKDKEEDAFLKDIDKAFEIVDRLIIEHNN